MTTDELIERAAKAIKPLFDAYCADLDAEDHAWEAAEKALAVFEQAYLPPISCRAGASVGKPGVASSAGARPWPLGARGGDR